MNHTHYAAIWDNYWNDTGRTSGQVFWDSPTERGADDDVRRFGDHLAGELPAIDVGCGHGTQTRALARRFARVVGVDVSPAGLDIARRNNPAPNLEYRVLDLLDPAAARALHDDLGDANVYMRAVLHQLGPAERAQAVASLSALLGERGRALVCELSPAADAYFDYLFAEFGGPPPELGSGDLERAFAVAGLVPHARGKGAIVTTLALPGGYPALVPTDLVVFARG
jgi:SAM-dependent methyltransferase